MTPAFEQRVRATWLLAATFLVAISGLIYELVAATTSSFLLGDTIRQFSLVIGIFLCAMGVGAWASRFVSTAVSGFIWAQILLGLVGGFIAPMLFISYAFLGQVQGLLYASLIGVGVLSGMEVPLIARILDEVGARAFRFENVLTADYVGALVASVAFPLLVIPNLGLMSASLVFGCLNLAVALFSLWLFRDRATMAQWLACIVALILSSAALVRSETLVSVVETNLFEDNVILSETTPYQQITITRFKERTRLFLDYSIQFDTFDEHRYHEALVHPAMSRAPRTRRVLILGGGDGMAAREVLRHDGVEDLRLVDLDPRVTELFSEHPDLSRLNDGALRDPRVTIVNSDAWKFVERGNMAFDVIIIDLPDPKNLALSKLYSTEFYALLTEILSADGIVVTQAGSPLFAREAFWSVERTLAQTRNPLAPGAGLFTTPYHVYVPSFGDWGFVMASLADFRSRDVVPPKGTRFLTDAVWRAAQVFGSDTGPVESEVNDLIRHVLVDYYEAGWARWFR